MNLILKARTAQEHGANLSFSSA